MDKEKSNFLTLRNKLFALYYEKKYKEALKVAEIAYENYKDKIIETTFWLACFNSLLKKKDKTIKILNNALDNGIWWSPQLMISESDFDFIKKYKEFKEILERCRVFFEKAQSKAKPKCLLFHPEDFNSKKENKLFIAIHFRGSNAEEFEEYFKKSVLKRGYMLAVPQSSQIFTLNKFCWDNREIAKKEISNHYNEINNKYRLDEKETIIAGASQGGGLSLELALGENELHIKKFISIIPGIVDVSSYIPLLKSGVSKNIKGFIITGEKDFYFQKVKELYEEAQKLKLQCKFVSIKGMGHNIPENFEDYLNEALDFLK